MKPQIPLILALTLTMAALSLADPPKAPSIPKLVSTSPAYWSVGVNSASQRAASLTFDQPMRSGFWDWFGRDVLSPNSDLHTTVASDGRTLSVDIKLAPGKVYIMGLNEKGLPGVGFQNEKGFSLPPTYLVFQTAGTPTPEDAPPRALTTNPANGAQNVDTARIKAVSVTFDKPMQVAKHGMHMRENQKEVDLSKARFQYAADGKSFTLAYDFKPASTYEFELNSVHDIGFASAKRVPLWPVKFAFSTQ